LNKGGGIILKKTIISFFLIAFFITSLTYFTDAFSQPDITIRALRKEDQIYIKVFTPTSIKNIRAHVKNQSDEILGIYNSNSYGIIKKNKGTYNLFIISSHKFNFNESDTISIYLKDKLLSTNVISAIPSDHIIFNDSDLSKQLKILTFNIHHGRDKMGNNTIDDIVEYIKIVNPDIIGLQEVDRNMIRTNYEDQIKIIAEQLSMNYVYGPNHKILNGQYGNGILSRYPIIDWENIKMNGKEKRGLLRAQLLVDSKIINVLITHLGLDEEERKTQFEIIETYIEIYKDNLIFLGDLNTNGKTVEVISLHQQLDDVAVKTSYNYKPTLNVFNNEERIDYIFVEKGNEILNYRVDKNQISDHFPVTAEILFK